MQEEIEVRFLDVNHDEVRAKLTAIGAECTHPMRLMKRAILDYPDRRMQVSSDTGWGWIRVRDEGNKITCTYKHIANDGQDTTHEIEYDVSAYGKTVELFEAIGLKLFSEQETRRESWELNGVEVVLDEWPWLPPYIEVEGGSKAAIQEVAEKLGFVWQNASRGSSDRVYRLYYPKMGFEESVSDIGHLTFQGQKPQWLVERQ